MRNPIAFMGEAFSLAFLLVISAQAQPMTSFDPAVYVGTAGRSPVTSSLVRTFAAEPDTAANTSDDSIPESWSGLEIYFAVLGVLTVLAAVCGVFSPGDAGNPGASSDPAGESEPPTNEVSGTPVPTLDLIRRGPD